MTEFQIVITCSTQHGAYYFMDNIPALHDVAIAAGFAVKTTGGTKKSVDVTSVEIVKTNRERVA